MCKICDQPAHEKRTFDDQQNWKSYAEVTDKNKANQDENIEDDSIGVIDNIAGEGSDKEMNSENENVRPGTFIKSYNNHINDGDSTDVSESLLSSRPFNDNSDVFHFQNQHLVPNDNSDEIPLLTKSADVIDTLNNNASSNQHPENNQSIDLNIASKYVISVSNKQSEINSSDGNSSGDFASEDDVQVAQLQQNKHNEEISRSQPLQIIPVLPNESSLNDMLKTPEKYQSQNLYLEPKLSIALLKN
ncbi:hypothetical protein HHI36_008592 [Cryptolaemus montrouzieri]|uniref:Uncharacterized protein n=1 Tax=Cryptolaemus montrouzieri TaxID=559131 RepID=A0ABD2MT13_9CUCU